MEEVFHDHFVNLLGKPIDRAHSLDLSYINISSHDLQDLEASFSKEEVWEAIRCLPPEKAPGPDGFSALFYQRCWGIIKQDIMAAFQALALLAGENFKLLNRALLMLLLKKQSA